MNNLKLNIFGQRGRKPLQIHFIGFCAAWLNEYLMPLLFGETHDFIFNARAVTRTNAVNFARIKRRTVQIFKNYPLGFRARVGDIARLGVFDFNISAERKADGFFIAVLRLKVSRVNASSVYARRSSRFKSAGENSQPFERFCKLHGGEHSVRSAFI